MNPAEKQVRDILTEQELAKAQQFAEDAVMQETVRKVLLLGLYENGTLKQGKPVEPSMNVALQIVAQRPDATNEDIGADIRALWEGISQIQVGLRKFDLFKTVTPVAEKKTNKAR